MRDSFRNYVFDSPVPQPTQQPPKSVPRQVIEIGCVTIVDWHDKFYLFRGVTVLEAQEPDSLPFATINAGEDSYKIAVLVAFIIAEHIRDGKLELPDFLTDDIEFGPNIGHDDDVGNVGTVSDDVQVHIVGADGRSIK